MNNYKILPPPNVSPADPLLYRALQLDNNLKVLLISDPTASLDDPNDQIDDEDLESGSEGAEESSEEGSDNSDSEGEPGPGLTSDVGLRNSAAALSVASGSFHEPKDAPGLAHFLEHMVFMGSKKYPDENKFDKFVSARNGWDNAYTDAEQTVYYFEVKPSAFDEALDIWSRFYIDPIMSKDSVNREIQAVDSEFSIAQTNDANRISGILCHLAAKASENHPSGKFGWGNILSLKGTKDTSSEAEIPKLYSNLLDLHKKYYSAKIMSLAVQSPHSLDELQEFVLSKFSEIPNRENFVDPFSTIEQFSSNVDIWKSCYGSNLIEVLPVGDKSKLYINFQLPPLMKEFKSDPAGYISWLLGHEGKGSVLDFLQEKELANSLEAGLGGYGDSFNHLYSLFEITISLTEKGAEKENLKTVLSAIFTYLEMLRKDGPKKEIWEMINKLENISWKTKEVSDPSDNVEGIAANMSKYPDSEHWLDADYVHPEYEPEKIQNLLDLMKYDRSVKMVVNPKFRQEISEKETEKEETIFPESDAWFGVRWRTSKDTYEFTDSQKLPDKTFFYPGKNPFLTDDLDLKVLEKEKTEFPIQINPKNDPKGILIFKPDFTFKLPKGDFRMIFKMEKFNQNMNVKQKALYSILPTFLVNMGSAELYDANAADFSYTISGRTEGLTFSAKGISEPLNKLVNTLMKYLVEFDNYDENMFNIAVEKSIKSIKTVLLDSGGLAQNVRLGYLMGNPQISILDVLKCLQSGDLTLNDLKIFVKELLKNSRAECAIHGNFTKKEALSIYKNDILGNRGLKNLIKGQPEHHEILVRKLPKKRQSIKLKSFNTRSADNHYVLKMYQYKLGDLYDDTILEVVAGIVSEPTFNTLSSYKNTYGVLGLTIEVKSAADSHSLSYINETIEDFTNHELIDLFKNLDNETFENYRKSLILEKSSKDNALKDEAYRNYAELEEGDRFYDRHLKKIEILEKLEKKDVSSFALDLLRKSHILDVHVEGNKSEVKEAETEQSQAAKDLCASQTQLNPSTTSITSNQSNDNRKLEEKKSLDNFEQFIFLPDSDIKDLKKKGKNYGKLPNLKEHYELMREFDE